MELVFLFMSTCREEEDECENLDKMSQGQDLKSHLSLGDTDEPHSSHPHEVFGFSSCFGVVVYARERDFLFFFLTPACLIIGRAIW